MNHAGPAFGGNPPSDASGELFDVCVVGGGAAGVSAALQAAALAAVRGVASDAIPFDELKRRLRASGAIVPEGN